MKRLSSDNGITAVERVYRWANALTGESLTDDLPRFYLPPQELRRLAIRLEHSSGNLYGLIGLQGTGKTSAAKYLAESAKETFYVKVESGGRLVQSLEVAFEDQFYRGMPERMYEELQNRCSDERFRTRLAREHDRIARFAKWEGQGRALRKLVEGEDPPKGLKAEWLAPFLNRTQVEAIRSEMLLQFLLDFTTIVIDPPDYPSKDRRALARDLNDIQGLWVQLQALGKAPNIVVTIQKELFMDQVGLSHYLLGKMDVTELRWLEPEQLVKIYQKTFGTCSPFSSDALLWVAKVSGGVPRRFKRYLRLCLEEQMISKSQTVSPTLAKRAIPPEAIAEGLTAELEALFQKGEMKEKARRLIAQVYHSEGPTNQKQLARQLDINEMDVGRILGRLEPYGYVLRTATGSGKTILPSA